MDVVTTGMSLMSAGGGALFTLTEVNIAPLVDTVKANAPLIIGAGITIVIIKAAVPLIPRMLRKVIG